MICIINKTFSFTNDLKMTRMKKIALIIHTKIIHVHFEKKCWKSYTCVCVYVGEGGAEKNSNFFKTVWFSVWNRNIINIVAIVLYIVLYTDNNIAVCSFGGQSSHALCHLRSLLNYYTDTIPRCFNNTFSIIYWKLIF